MILRDFLHKNFTFELVQEFKKGYETNHTKSAYSQFINRDVSRLKLQTWKIIANHFTDGDSARLMELLNTQEQEIKAKKPPKKITLKELLK